MSETNQPGHLHRCQNCGTVWGHGDMMAADIEAHKCPKCGKAEWRKYSGGGRPAAVAQMPARGSAKQSASWTPVLLDAVMIAAAFFFLAASIVAFRRELRG